MPVVKDIYKLKRITALFVAPNKLPKPIIMPPTERTIKELISGPIKTIKLQNNVKENLVILCNANKDKNLSNANRYIRPYGIIYGNFIIVKKVSSDEYRSLNKEEIDTYSNMFGYKSINLLRKQVNNLVAFRRALRRM